MNNMTNCNNGYNNSNNYNNNNNNNNNNDENWAFQPSENTMNSRAGSFTPNIQSSNVPMDQSFVTGASNVPETLTNNAFLPAYLIANIGNWARISMLVGDDIVEVVGEIWIVGASYVILKTLEPNTTIMVDLFSIKMITIIYDEDLGKLIRR